MEKTLPQYLPSKKYLAFLFAFLLLHFQAVAQLIVTPPTPGTTAAQATQLAQSLVGTGVVVSNAQITGGTGSYGLFNGAGSNIGINSGVLLTSGAITNAVGPNFSPSTGTDNFGPGNGYLDALISDFTQDACMLEFDLQVSSDTLRFQYSFASEEYPEYACAGYNDAFGFFINGPGVVGNVPGYPGVRNIAYLPGGLTPVTIDNVNDVQGCALPVNMQYYIDNFNGLTVEYDGFTVVLTAQITGLIPCQVYHLRIAVADVGDGIYDSGVFIKGGSLTSTVIQAVTNSPVSSPICEGQTLNMSITNPQPGTSYTWTGPGFTGTGTSINIPNATAANNGTYTVSTTSGTCNLQAGMVTVFIGQQPVATVASNNGPICAGQPLQLSAQPVTGATYSWSGPGITAALANQQDPLIPAASTSDAGNYSVFVVQGNCGVSPPAITTVTVSAAPAAPTAANTGPFCTGDPVQLSAQGPATATYSWTGPGITTATQNLQHPMLANASAALAGVYSVTMSLGPGCTSPPGQTTVVIGNSPVAPGVSNNGPLCSGQVLELSASGPATGIYSWTGPGITATNGNQQIVTISNVTVAEQGTYSVFYTNGNCGLSPAGVTTVAISPVPAAPVVSYNGPLCVGDTLKLTAQGPASASYSWIGPGITATTETLQLPVIPNATAATAGVYSVTSSAAGCTSAPTTANVVINTVPPVPVALNNGPLCAGQSLTISASGPATATYSWVGPGVTAANGNLQNLSLGSASAAVAGAYTVYNTSGSCGVSTGGTTNVTVNPVPAAPAPSYNNPVCAGNTLQLMSGGTSGSYSWSGPGITSFNFTQQNPSIPNATTSMSGLYSVINISPEGCISAPGTLQVMVGQSPAAPVLSSNSPVCTGSTIQLSASGAAGAYSWSGPGITPSTANNQHPIIPAASATMSGAYSATVSSNGCISAPGTVQVTVINPAPVVFSNSPVCVGQSLTLSTVLMPGASYTWTSPNASTYLGQILTITNVQSADSGLYTLTSTMGGCTSPPTVINGLVAPEPVAPAIISNSPVCTGQTLTLSTSPVAGASYFWSGPQGGYHTQVVTIPGSAPVTPAYTGTYSLYLVSDYGCYSDTSLAPIVVTPTPSQPALNSNSPLCEGDSIFLSAAGNWSANASFSWTGPGGYFTSLQQPVRANAVPAYSGNYTLVVTDNGCTSLPGVLNVVVNPAPATPPIISNSPVCSGQSLLLSTNPVANGTYTWSGPNGFTSGLQSPVVQNSTLADAGLYSLYVTNHNGCSNLLLGTALIDINQTPGVNALAPTTVCEGNDIQLTATSNILGVYSWSGPAGFTSTVANPIVYNAQLNYSGTYHVWVTANGCTGEDTVHIFVNPEPSAPVPASNSPICAEQTLQLFAGGPPAGPTVAYSWTGPNNFTSTVKDPVIANATVAAQGNYFVTVFVNGCPSPAGIVQVTIHPVPNMSITQSNSLICQGQSSTLTASGTGAISHSWTPTTGLSPATGLVVTATPTVTTTYSLLSTNSQGCVSTDTITVTVLPAVQANAGPDQAGLCPATSTTLAAVVPATGTGAWSIASGTGGTIQNPLQANSLFTGQLNQSYQLVWTVTNPPCAPVTDTVQIDFFSSEPQPQVTINNSPICQGQTLQLATGLVPGATYTWTGPLGTYFGQGLIITSATAAHSGLYTLHYTTSTGCQSAPVLVPFTVTPLPAAPVFTSNSPLCAGNTLSFTAATVANATYSWTGPNNFNSQVQNPVINNVTAADAGDYTLIVSVNGCSSLPSIQQVQVLPAVLQPQATSNSPVCEGGTLLLTASASASANATYSWVGPNSFASAQQNTDITSVSSINSGAYTVFTLLNGCTSQAGVVNVIIHANPAQPVVSSNGQLCEGSNLILSVTNPIGGAAYNWTGPNNYLGIGQTVSINNVSQQYSGTYLVTVADQNGCNQSTAGSIAVTVTPAPTVTASSNSPLCHGNTLQLSAGTVSGATYSWTGPAITPASATLQNPTISNALPSHSGTYQVFITRNGCTKDSAIAVLISPQPTAPQAVSNSPVCTGQTLNLSPAGAFPPGSTFSWTGPNGFTSTTQSPAIPMADSSAAGWYQLYINVNGCQSAASLTEITVNPVPQMSVSQTQNTICIGQNTELTASGANFGYSWTPATGLNANVGGLVTATPTATTTYTVYGTNTNQGCPATDTLTIIVNHPVSADAGPDQLNLCGATTQLSANATGLWSVISGPGGGFSDVTLGSCNFTGQPGEAYTLAWSTGNAPCPASSDEVTISFVNAVALPVASGGLLCEPGSTTLTAVAPALGQTIEWYTDTAAAPVVTGPSFTTPVLSQTNTYYVTVSNGTCRSDFVPVVATVGQYPDVQAGFNVQIDQGQATQLMATSSTLVSYSWTPANSLTAPLTANPIAIPAETTLYTVYATSAAGCSTMDTLRVSVIPSLQIPNGFTPNGDGQNDVWFIPGLTEGYVNCKVEIFNRWGSLVYSSKGYSKPWDGTYNGKHLDTTTFYYIIYLDNGAPPLSGPVTIIR